MRHRFIAVLLIAGMLLGAAASAQQGRAWTSEELLAATVTQQEVETLTPPAGAWWPKFPEFHGGKSTYDPRPGERFFCITSYQTVSDGPSCSLDNALTCYTDLPSAAKAYEQAAAADKGERIDGPTVADGATYRAGVEDDAPFATIRFHSGDVVSRVTVTGMKVTPQTLAGLASAVCARLAGLRAGRLLPAPFPADLAALLPPPAAEQAVGPVLGTAAGPPENWALIESGMTPKASLALFHKGGVERMGFRTYDVPSSPGTAIDIVFFRFATPEAAAGWVQTYIAQVKADGHPLDAGRTGTCHAFAHTMVDNGLGGLLELQFARGCVAVDVTAYAPYTKLDPAAESRVRALAEAWYASLAPAHPRRHRIGLFGVSW